MTSLRNAWLPIAIAVVVASAAFAGEPQIIGPTEVEPGDLVILRLDVPESAKVDWQAFGQAEKLSNWAALEDGRVVVFASRTAGVYNFVCAVWDGEQIDLLLHRVENGDGGPQPDPPGPSPTPSGWEAWTTRTAESLVDSSNRAAEAQAIAQAMRSVVSSVRGGEFSDAREARESLRAATRARLGSVPAIERWQAFSDAVDERLDAEAGSGELSLQEYATIWEAIAKGLEAVD